MAYKKPFSCNIENRNSLSDSSYTKMFDIKTDIKGKYNDFIKNTTLFAEDLKIEEESSRKVV